MFLRCPFHRLRAVSLYLCRHPQLPPIALASLVNVPVVLGLHDLRGSHHGLRGRHGHLAAGFATCLCPCPFCLCCVIFVLTKLAAVGHLFDLAPTALVDTTASH